MLSLSIKQALNTIASVDKTKLEKKEEKRKIASQQYNEPNMHSSQSLSLSTAKPECLPSGQEDSFQDSSLWLHLFIFLLLNVLILRNSVSPLSSDM